MKSKYMIALAAMAFMLASAPAFADDNGRERYRDGRYEERHEGEAKVRLGARLSGFVTGIVTSVNGSIFTIDPTGSKSTTTVSTDSSTRFKAKGNATSTGSLHVGSRVMIVGTTTATSTDGDSVSASIVKVLGNGFGHIKAWFSFHGWDWDRRS